MEKSDAEAVNSAPLALQCIHDVQCGHSLPTRVLCVRDRIAEHVLQECLEHTAGLFIDQAADTLHTATSCKPSDCWLCDSLDIVAHDLSVTRCSTFANRLFLCFLTELVPLRRFRCRRCLHEPCKSG